MDSMEAHLAVAKYQKMKVGILRVNNKCAEGAFDFIGVHVKARIDNGYFNPNTKVVVHKCVHRKTTEIKAALLEMSEYCQVVFTLGWGRFRPDPPIICKAAEPRIKFPQWTQDIIVRKVGSFVVPMKCLFLHLRESKRLAEIGLSYVAPRLALKVDDIVTGRYEPPDPNNPNKKKYTV